MGATTSLSTIELNVEPGSQVVAELRVHNTGRIVDNFTFQPLGDGASWIRVEPPTMNLFPDASETAIVTISPPRDSSAIAGPTAIGIRTQSAEDPSGSSVVEATVHVGPFTAVGGELSPKTDRGSRVGRFEFAFDNRGNMPTTARLAGTDPEDELTFDFSPAVLEGPPGRAQFSTVRVKPRSTFWTGQPRSHPFQILMNAAWNSRRW